MIDFDKWWEAEEARGFSEDREVEDSNGCWWRSRWELFWCGNDGLNLCGCGTDDPPRIVARILWALWESHKARKDVRTYDYIPDDPTTARVIYGKDKWDDPIVEFALHVLGSRDIVEHGTSIGGAWLTEKGVAAAEAVFATPAPEAPPPAP